MILADVLGQGLASTMITAQERNSCGVARLAPTPDHGNHEQRASIHPNRAFIKV